MLEVRYWKACNLVRQLEERFFLGLRLEKGKLTYVYTRYGQFAIISHDLYDYPFFDLLEEISPELNDRHETFPSSILRLPSRVVEPVRERGVIEASLRGRGTGVILICSCLARLFELSQECHQPGEG